MTQIMTPSESMTAGQIGKTVANFRAMLEKHAPEFSASAVQTVLGQAEFIGECFGIFRKRVEAVSDLISRVVRVDRTRTPQQVLDDTGRTQYTSRAVVNSMPKGEGEEVEVVFFKLGRYVSDADLEKEYELRGLKPADPYSLAAVNQDNPEFADERPNATHWKDSESNWCFATFSRWNGGRSVRVNRYDNDWGDCWWFAGLHK